MVVLNNSANAGKAASLWKGFECALSHDIDGVISLDADGQHRPDDIPSLAEAARHAPNDLIIAARLGERGQTPRLRRFGQIMADFWIGWAVGKPIRDTQSGYRWYPSGLLSELDVPHGQAHSFAFESEVLIEANHLGVGISWIAVNAIYGREARASYYRAVADTTTIVRMVAVRLLSRGLNPRGLLRVLGVLRAPQTKHTQEPPSLEIKP